MNQDILVAAYLADNLAEQTGLLVASAINYGINLPCDQLFCGTTSLTPFLLKNIIFFLTSWWLRQGFKYFFLLTFHAAPYHLQAIANLDKNFFLLKPFEVEYKDILEKQTTIRLLAKQKPQLLYICIRKK